VRNDIRHLSTDPLRPVSTGNALIALSYLLSSKCVEAGSILYESNDSKRACQSPDLSFVIGGTVTVYFEGHQAGSLRRSIEMLSTMERGYFFGQLCTPKSVTKIVATEYQEVFLLQTGNQELTSGRFGCDVLSVMKRHQADEEHLFSQRIARFFGLMRELRARDDDSRSIAALRQEHEQDRVYGHSPSIRRKRVLVCRTASTPPALPRHRQKDAMMQREVLRCDYRACSSV
jgi:hypothetical protein